MKSEIPNTIGYEVNKALIMLEGFVVTIEETSTPFQDKKDERQDKTPIVVRQLNRQDGINLTVARFK